MAKTKKKEALSLEEKLEQALVPVDEQPYEVPDNWCFFRFTSLINIEGGTQPPKSQFVEEPQEGYVRLVQIRDFASNKYIVYVPDTKKLRKFNKNDIMIARYGASIGRICTGLEGAYNVALAKTIFSEKVLNREYVYWMLQSETFQNPLTSISRSAQAGFNKEDLYGFTMPLPPLAEQQRIVEQIESLFAKLDEAKEKVQAVADGYEDRVSAIYNAAFRGTYTAKWRAQKGIIMEDTWEKVVSQNVCEPITCGKTPKEYITDSGEVPYLKVYNIVDNQIDFVKTPQYIPRDIHEGKLKSSMLKSGDVIMNIVGPPLRKVAIIPEDYPEWNMNQAIVRFRLKKDKMLSKYLYYALLNPETLEEVISQTRGVVGQANISVSQSRNLELPCPSLEEQQEIVKILDSLLYKEKAVLEKVNNIIESIDAMKKSVLADAFRGRLGTNISSEESSVNLLREILSEEA